LFEVIEQDYALEARFYVVWPNIWFGILQI